MTMIISVSTAQTIVDDAYFKINNPGGSNSCTFTVIVNDASGLEEIELKLSSVKDGDDLLSCSFNCIQNSGLPQGWSYTRNGNLFTFTGGSFTELNLYYAQVTLKTGGNWGDAFRFIAN